MSYAAYNLEEIVNQEADEIIIFYADCVFC